jgi:hypothetical protein
MTETTDAITLARAELERVHEELLIAVRRIERVLEQLGDDGGLS